MKKFFLCSVIAISMSFVGCSKAPESYENSKIVTSYKQAQSDGYTGSLDEWVALTNQYQQNPQQAQAVAAQSGYDGSDVLLAGVAGAVAGHMIANNSNDYDRKKYYNQPKQTVVKKTVVVNNYNTQPSKATTNNSLPKTSLPANKPTTISTTPTVSLKKAPQTVSKSLPYSSTSKSKSYMTLSKTKSYSTRSSSRSSRR